MYKVVNPFFIRADSVTLEKAKPIVWVKNAQTHLADARIAQHDRVDESGKLLEPRLSHKLSVWNHYYRGIAEVRVWRSFTRIKKEWTDEILWTYLGELLQAVKNKKMTGAEASLAKWDAVIEYTETLEELPPYRIWWNTCGLCIEYEEKEIDCLLSLVGGQCDQCQDIPAVRKLKCTDSVAEWLLAAREFRAYIAEKCGVKSPKTEPEYEERECPACEGRGTVRLGPIKPIEDLYEWTYGVWEGANNKFIGSYNGTWAKRLLTRSSTPEETISKLLEVEQWGGKNELCKGTPIFGVRRLTIADKGLGPTSIYCEEFGAFYKGRHILEPWSTQNSGISQQTSQTCIERVLVLLKKCPECNKPRKLEDLKLVE